MHKTCKHHGRPDWREHVPDQGVGVDVVHREKREVCTFIQGSVSTARFPGPLIRTTSPPLWCFCSAAGDLLSNRNYSDIKHRVERKKGTRLDRVLYVEPGSACYNVKSLKTLYKMVPPKRTLARMPARTPGHAQSHNHAHAQST